MIENIVLYINTLTANCIKIQLIANALELKVDYKFVQLHKAEQYSESFQQINPGSQVPVLVTPSFTLTESNAILHYLAAKRNSKLWPKDITHQSLVLKALFAQSDLFNSAVGAYAHRRVVLPHWGNNLFTIDDEMEIKFHKALSQVERQLEASPAIAGEQFTIADISLASFLIFYAEADMPIQNYIATLDWLARLEDEPWFRKTKNTLLDTLSEEISK